MILRKSNSGNLSVSFFKKSTEARTGIFLLLWSKNVYINWLRCFNLQSSKIQKCSLALTVILLTSADIKINKTLFKAHLKWSTLNFSRKYKKIVFQTSRRNFLFGKRACSLMVSDLRSETKGSWFKSGS